MKNYDEMFDNLAENISGINTDNERYGECDENGVSAWYFEYDYDKYIDSEYDNTNDGMWLVDGVEYYEHWFFVNEKHNSSVCGYSLLSDDGDIKFCVVGCRTDFVCDFETMYKYLTNEHYFVD